MQEQRRQEQYYFDQALTTLDVVGLKPDFSTYPTLPRSGFYAGSNVGGSALDYGRLGPQGEMRYNLRGPDASQGLTFEYLLNASMHEIAHLGESRMSKDDRSIMFSYAYNELIPALGGFEQWVKTRMQQDEVHIPTFIVELDIAHQLGQDFSKTMFGALAGLDVSQVDWNRLHRIARMIMQPNTHNTEQPKREPSPPAIEDYGRTE